MTVVSSKGHFLKFIQKLELKEEHSGDHATFLCIDVTIENRRFINKSYNKRGDFSFSIVRMSHMCSNIPKAIFYSALVGQYLRIGRSTLKTEHFTPKAGVLLQRMISQGASVSV